jgi:hypothetical protein
VVDHFPEAPLETAEDNTPGPNEDPGGTGDGAAGGVGRSAAHQVA